MAGTVDIPCDEEALGKLADMELALAREFFLRAQGAEDRDEAIGYAAEFRKLTRSCRLSIALRQRFMRERAQDAKAAAAELAAQPPEPLPPEQRARVARRKEELFDAVARVVWRETEGEEREMLFDVLRERVHKRRLPEDFGDASLDEEVVALCDELGLRPSAAEAWRDFPPAGREDEDDEDDAFEPALESSA